ncbi:hypothetical protein EDEG_03423 [Edhazardia aedis USNM 41457]|uniref:SCP domain-containing protein n=1 Tax=Edhazardia aedis (strain USNM 41457) TaxID=1003232 RepID=J9DHP6_EDHAE|nr:hypothetical protein EDEG_03423 [Edhazardia aedis USNM 41457]|eukprot:EJW02135.1 hypothetical protein EDEG_03423 [Edhazardia aedis USNM 41457]
MISAFLIIINVICNPEDDLFNEINQHRDDIHDLKPLFRNSDLDWAARFQASYIKKTSHLTSLNSDANMRTPQDRIRSTKYGYTFYSAEQTILTKENDVKSALKAIISNKNENNIVNSAICNTFYVDIGIGSSKDSNGNRYWVILLTRNF